VTVVDCCHEVGNLGDLVLPACGIGHHLFFAALGWALGRTWHVGIMKATMLQWLPEWYVAMMLMMLQAIVLMSSHAGLSMHIGNVGDQRCDHHGF